MASVAAHEQELKGYALQQMSRVPGLSILGSSSPRQRVGALSFMMEPVPGTLIAAVLAHEWGIGVRAGCFCAQPGMMHLLAIPEEDREAVEAAILEHANPGAVRSSLGLYNSTDDEDSLCQALRAMAGGDYDRSRYRIDPASGTFVPRDWQPDFSAYFSLR